MFRIHRYLESKKRTNVIVLVIVSLTKVKSKMKIVRCNEFVYDYVGSGAMYMSQLWHESLFAENVTVKIALFYEGNKAMRKIVDEEKITID